jgi:hypothetical protein
MSYTNGLDDPTIYFNTKLYSGDASSSQPQTGVGFQPDLVWLKSRNTTDGHFMIDSVRGATKAIRPYGTNAEVTDTAGLLSFDTDGFTVGSSGPYGASGQNYVAWNWKAGTSFSNDASSTGIGTIDSSGSVSTDAGFSIITWTGNATSSQSVAHGLGAVPKVILTKNTDNGSQPWKCYFEPVGNAKYLQLNATDVPAISGVWSSTTPTSSIISISNDTGINGSGNTILAYCFAEKKGYSKFGSYTGNGNADGTFVYTGFKPAWVMIKNSSHARDWIMMDNKRDPDNVVSNRLFPNNTDAQNTNNDMLDFTSNGFKIRNTNTTANLNGGTYIYMAFAESPFVTSTGIPTTAR